MKTLKLSLPCAEWLAADSGLSLSASSPFAFLRDAEPRSSAAERKAAAEAELFALGIFLGPRAEESRDDSAPFREGLELLAQPEARIQIVTQVAGKPPIKMTLFARAGQGCAFVSDQKTFHVGPRRSLESTFTALQEQVRAPRDLEGRQILFWPSVLAVWVMLWPGAGQDLTQRLPKEEALRRLAALGADMEKVEAVLHELEQKDLLLREGGAWEVPAAYRPWLRAALSGHLLQIDFSPLNEEGALEKADESAARLLFVGPSSARVLYRTLAGEELTQALRGTPANEERAIRLSALPAGPLADILRMHLGLGPPDRRH